MPNEQTRLDNLDCVYKAAYELFIENGVENTTKVMMVRKTGLSLSSVNRYFASKLDCVVGTARWLSHNMNEPNFFSLEHIFGSTNAGYSDLESYLNQTKALFYDNPKLFVFCIECRAYAFRNAKDRKRACEAIRQAFGTSKFIENIHSWHQGRVHQGDDRPQKGSDHPARGVYRFFGQCRTCVRS